MAGVATTSKAIFWSWLIAFIAGVGVAYFFAQPYLCEVKVNHGGKPTYCHVKK